MIEIKKYKYINEKGDGIEIPHEIKTLGRIVTLVKRDGYFPLLQTALPEINDSGTVYIYFYPIKGIKRTKSSRGFRTFYRITCRGFDELQYALKKLGYKNYKG